VPVDDLPALGKDATRGCDPPSVQGSPKDSPTGNSPGNSPGSSSLPLADEDIRARVVAAAAERNPAPELAFLAMLAGLPPESCTPSHGHAGPCGAPDCWALAGNTSP